MTASRKILPLEDDWYDILKKAMWGLHRDEARTAKDTGISEGQLRKILNGARPPDPVLEKLGEVLGLRVPALLALAHEQYAPRPFDPGRWPGVAQITSPYLDFTVNAYGVWSPASREAVLVDTGTDFQAIQAMLDESRLKLAAVCVTHAHGDHIGVLEQVMKAYQPRLFAPQTEPLPNAQGIGGDFELSAGGLKGRSLFMNGHSIGHLAYVFTGVAGWPAPAVFTGDALFAGSMGRGNISYERLRSNLQNRLLALPPAALLGPGHGPMTTVGEERESNPFA